MSGSRLQHVRSAIDRFVRGEAGATSIEYGLIAALVALVAIPAMSTIGSKLSDTFGLVSLALDTPSVPPEGGGN